MGFFVWFVFTALWAGVGGVLPMFLPINEHSPLIKLMLRMTAVMCYTMWLVTYMAQMNPLFGPQLSGVTQQLIKKEW